MCQGSGSVRAACRQSDVGARAEAVKASRVRLALNIEEACAALGVSWDFWSEHIAPEIRVVRRGRRKLVAVAELERWLERNGEATLHRGDAR
jgi:hypothetical protein